MKETHIFKLPHLGEGVDSAEISEILVSPNDKINNNTPILILESEKASIEIPAETKGTIDQIFVNKGETIKTGDKIVSIITEDFRPPKKTTEEEKSPQEVKEELKKEDTPKERTIKNFRTSPSVRKLSRELNINLNEIEGTGRKGRISREDLINEIKRKLGSKTEEPEQETDYSLWGPTKEKALSKINLITGTKTERAWRTVPQVTQFNKADISEIDILRKKLNKKNTNKITFLPFLIKATVKTLKSFPDFNSSLAIHKKSIIQKKYYNINIAVNTSEGLTVPVLRGADKKDIQMISEELKKISDRAKRKKLKPTDLQGGSFTISSLGGIGGTYFTPIINPPQVAILGVSRAKLEPVYSKKDNKFEPRLVLPFSLTYDHRVIDGASAADFTEHLRRALSFSS